ncbi:hypothetical protein Psta_4465 [Pirellula staleyi DSM 6068]|uniref:Uncharacterized protein n=1 Tax=Pirellula staleyi (strain ATCC 27377 / DSM 6068 / ICPB 4128) TaxID=530564 RepID=D2R624_PIRSD|nr:hypothetical protein [Pirellula staleyi]ADB19109.1 hypothetical protein Psta_4465 [Pirellula staleyi DSM 6068]
MQFPNTWSHRFLREFQQSSLRKLIALTGNSDPTEECRFDLRIRGGDSLEIYHGLERLLTVQSTGDERIELNAPRRYRQLPEHEALYVMGLTLDSDQLATGIDQYLRAASLLADERFFRDRKEGYWTNQLLKSYGVCWQSDSPWLMFDRWSSIRFETDAEEDAFYRPLHQEQLAKRAKLQQQDRANWGENGFLNRAVDILAIGPEQQLVCFELMLGSNLPSLYWGCQEAAFNRDMFSMAKEYLSQGIKTLVEQYVELGLLPPTCKSWLPAKNFESVETNLVIIDPPDDAEVWKRFDLANEILGIPRLPVGFLRSSQDSPSILWR